MPVLEYWFEQSVIVRAGALVPLGAAPDAGRFQGLTGQDVLAQSQAWRDATRTLGLRSEYGMTSFGLFGQVGLYFQ